MRVLAIGSLYPPHHLGGGYELTWRNAMRDLRARGHSVRVLTTDHREPAAAGLPEEDGVHRELRWYWDNYAFPRLSIRERIELERHNQGVLARHLDAFGPDVVNLWAMGGMSLSLIELVRRARLPAVGIVGDQWFDYAPAADGWLSLVDHLGVRSLAERATGLVATVDFDRAARWLFNSAWIRDTTMRSRPHLAAAVAHPGIDPAVAAPAPPEPWRWRLLYLGRVDRRKGIHTAIAALSHLPDQATLSVVGDGEAAEVVRLQEVAEQFGVDDRVRFEPARPHPEIGRVIAAHDVVLFPVTWPEPWGLVPIEAMGVGRPVVATGTGGSAEFLVDGKNCLLAAVEDPNAFAAAVGRLAKDESLRERLCAGGQTTAARYTEAAYHDAIERALEAASRPR